MSVAEMCFVKELPCFPSLTAKQQIVLFILADMGHFWATARGFSVPMATQDRIAHILGMSTRAVTSTIASCKAKGVFGS